MIIAWVKLGRLGFRPKALFGTGGYIAFPVCVAAALRGIKIVLLEPNAVAGLANKVLCRFCRAVVFVTSSSTIQPLTSRRADVRLLPAAPVRRGMSPATEEARRDAISNFFREPAHDSVKRVILVLGGSLGSRPVNEAVLGAIPELSRLPGLGILWQVTGFPLFAVRFLTSSSFSSLRLEIENMDLQSAIERGGCRLGPKTMTKSSKTWIRWNALQTLKIECR